jgi:hypothetical protein
MTRSIARQQLRLLLLLLPTYMVLLLQETLLQLVRLLIMATSMVIGWTRPIASTPAAAKMVCTSKALVSCPTYCGKWTGDQGEMHALGCRNIDSKGGVGVYVPTKGSASTPLETKQEWTKRTSFLLYGERPR